MKVYDKFGKKHIVSLQNVNGSARILIDGIYTLATLYGISI